MNFKEYLTEAQTKSLPKKVDVLTHMEVDDFDEEKDDADEYIDKYWVGNSDYINTTNTWHDIGGMFDGNISDIDIEDLPAVIQDIMPFVELKHIMIQQAGLKNKQNILADTPQAIHALIARIEKENK